MAGLAGPDFLLAVTADSSHVDSARTEGRLLKTTISTSRSVAEVAILVGVFVTRSVRAPRDCQIAALGER